MPETSFFLSRLMQPVSPNAGESGYFSAPEDTLDPHLFDGDRIKPDVRRWITSTLYTFWSKRFRRPEDWSTVWIAGSGISYQWAAGRGNGDLDILIGVDYIEFFEVNPEFRGMSPDDLSAVFNADFHEGLWPQTAESNINGGVYEVTFYVNPRSTDIRDINPYAAYNLTDDEWTVRPPSGDDFNHPKEFYDYAERERFDANALVVAYNAAAEEMKKHPVGSPSWHNTMSVAQSLVQEASSLYDSIHLGRKQAFAPGGSGYGDWYNFRWQYHKKQGTAQALHQVAAAHKAAQDEFNAQVYGGPIEGADVILRRAALHARGLA